MYMYDKYFGKEYIIPCFYMKIRKKDLIFDMPPFATLLFSWRDLPIVFAISIAFTNENTPET